MRRRLLTLVALALLGALSAACAEDVAPAARIGDRTITEQELLDEVAEWAANEQTQRSVDLRATASSSGYAMGPVVSILQERIVFEVTGPAFDDLGVELDDQMITDALTVLLGDPSQAESAFAGFSQAYADEYVEELAKGIVVQGQLGDEGFVDLIRDATRDVEVNPRYGTWDPENISIVPPEGPRPAPGAVDPFLGL